MSFFVQLLCTEAIDSTACVVIGTDSYRIIVNCGEGVQRLCVEHKIRLGKVSHVLTTNAGPQYSFGLPGNESTARLF
jgi:ribonuclease Z